MSIAHCTMLNANASNIRRSARLANKHFHPYVLCVIDMQPAGFNNANIIIANVLHLIREAILRKAFIVIAQFKHCGETHPQIISEIADYPHKAYCWHIRNDKSIPIKTLLDARRIFVRQIKVCGVNTEYCVKATVHGLTKKYYIPIKVIENACNGNDYLILAAALHKMRTAYINVEVI